DPLLADVLLEPLRAQGRLDAEIFGARIAREQLAGQHAGILARPPGSLAASSLGAFRSRPNPGGRSYRGAASVPSRTQAAAAGSRHSAPSISFERSSSTSKTNERDGSPPA